MPPLKKWSFNIRSEFMAVAARLFGGLIGFGGFCNVLPSIGRTSDAFRFAADTQVNDTTSKKVARVATEAFRIAGSVTLGIAAIVLGLQMITMGPQLGFFASVLSGTKLALPYIAGGVAQFAAGALAQIHGGPCYVPPAPLASQSAV